MQTATLAADRAPADPGAVQRWAALDDRDEWEAFSRPVAGQEGCWESFLAIEGMHCAACALTVEQALRTSAGVSDVQVNGASAVARVVWTPGTGRPTDWLAALGRAGYGGLPAGDMLTAAPRLAARRVLLWRWLVAGFCMMQVMMYAVPAYVADPGDITPDVNLLLRWACWVLTIPVVLFSCWPFFAAAWRDLRNRRVGMDVPVALGIAIAFAASTAATFDPGGPLGSEVWYDSVTMFVFFLLSGRLLEQRLRDRTAGALEVLMRRLPETVERRTALGTFERVAARRLGVGDVIRVLPGEAFPADGLVLEGRTRADEALLTGESTPVVRQAGDEVIAGSHNLSGAVLVRVSRTGDHTRFASIVALMEQASVQKPRLARLADRIATPFLVGVLLAAAGAALWWWSQGAGHAIGVAVAVLIVTCPCALSLATPAATLAAAGALARRGVLVRRLQAFEDGAQVDAVVFDKTGTLSMEAMSVLSQQSRPGTDAAQARAMAAALARHSFHPASRAVAAAAPTAGGSAWLGQQVQEVTGQGIEGVLVHPDQPLPLRLRLGSARFCGAPQVEGAGGRSQVHLADEQGWLASFVLDETPRADAGRAIDDLRRAGLEVALLSGDRSAAVASMAERCGIADARGDQSPEDKLAHIQSLQAQGRRVVMVGDGLNDGPVLACANISVAMGQSVPLAQTQSDFVVPGGQLRTVALVLAQSRRASRIVRQNLAWAAGYNALCVPLALVGAMPPWLAGLGMALSSFLVVANSARLARLPGDH